MGRVMERVRVGVYYDFASSLCYVAHRVIGRIAPQLDDLAIDLLWKPIDLTLLVPWQRGDSFPATIRKSVEATALWLGVDLRMPEAWIDSRPSSAVALTLTEKGRETEWRNEVFRWVFGHKGPASAPKIEELAKAVRLKIPAGTAQRLDDVVRATEEAIALGVEGVPTFLLDTWPVGGIHDEESMLAMLARFAENYRNRAAEEKAN